MEAAFIDLNYGFLPLLSFAKDLYLGKRFLGLPTVSLRFPCLLLCPIPLISNLPVLAFCAVAGFAGTPFSRIDNAFSQISAVVLSESAKPSDRISTDGSVILPRIFLNPYAAAALVLLPALPNKASFKMSKPSSCIQDRLKAARRATGTCSEYNLSLNCASSFIALASFSRPESFLLSNLIRAPTNLSASMCRFLKPISYP